jgi:hypothetical protein
MENQAEAIFTLTQLPKIRQFIRLNLLVSAIILGCLAGLLCISLLVPCSSADSDAYFALYLNRKFQSSKLFFFFGMLYAGKIYVQSVTLRSYLRDLHDIRDSYTDNILFFSINFGIFVIAANTTIESNCSGDSFLRAFLIDFLCYAVPYVLFLHITYVIAGTLVKINIPIFEMWKLSRWSIMAVILIAMFLVGLISYQLFLLYTYGRIFQYLIAYGILASVIAIVVCMLRGKYQVNDYYFFFIVAVPMTATPSAVSAVLQACLIGIYVEASCRVGISNVISRQD